MSLHIRSYCLRFAINNIDIYVTIIYSPLSPWIPIIRDLKNPYSYRLHVGQRLNSKQNTAYVSRRSDGHHGIKLKSIWFFTQQIQFVLEVNTEHIFVTIARFIYIYLVFGPFKAILQNKNLFSSLSVYSSFPSSCRVGHFNMSFRAIPPP